MMIMPLMPFKNVEKSQKTSLMMVQWVELLPHIFRVLGSILRLLLV